MAKLCNECTQYEYQSKVEFEGIHRINEQLMNIVKKKRMSMRNNNKNNMISNSLFLWQPSSTISQSIFRNDFLRKKLLVNYPTTYSLPCIKRKKQANHFTLENKNFYSRNDIRIKSHEKKRLGSQIMHRNRSSYGLVSF